MRLETLVRVFFISLCVLAIIYDKTTSRRLHHTTNIERDSRRAGMFFFTFF